MINVQVIATSFPSQSVVEIFFTEDDYRVNEDFNSNPDGTGNMPVRVIKSSQIANPIVFDVVPLTVEMANTNLLDAEIPSFNPFSPPYAGNIIITCFNILWKLSHNNSILLFYVLDLNDFDNTVIKITFEPDENAPDNERAAPIAVVNDLINEADEQVFIFELRLISSTNPAAIAFTTRPASLCKITNDDRKLYSVVN